MKNVFDIGNLLDVKHTSGEWLIAKIIDRENDFIKIRYDGIKTDLSLKITSNKIAPFRKYTKGYTCFQKKPWRCENEFNIDNLKMYTEYLSNPDSFLKNSDARIINQILRGHIFIYLDNILTKEEEYNDQQMISILRFIDSYLSFSVKYFRYYPNLFQAFQEGMNNPESIVTKRDVALSFGIYEILDSLFKLFGINNIRIMCFSTFYNKEDKQGYGIFTTECNFVKGRIYDEHNRMLYIKNESNIQHDFEINMINTFGKYGGFNAIENMISTIGNTSSLSSTINYDKNNNNTNNNNKSMMIMNQFIYFHMNLYKSISLMLSELAPIFTDDFAKTFIPNLENILRNRMNAINDKEIKDIDFDIIKSILLSHEKILSIIYFEDEKNIGLILENIELEILYKFLECSSFDRKLKALNGLKDFQYRTEEKHLDEFGYKTPTKYYNPDIYIEWLMNKNIIRLIYEKYNHVELLKRSLDLLKFIGSNKEMPIEIINIIWDSLRDKSEEVILTIYDNIIELAYCLDQNSIKYFYSKFLTIKLEEYDEDTIKLIGNFTLNSLNTMFPNQYMNQNNQNYHQQQQQHQIITPKTQSQSQSQTLTQTQTQELIIDDCSNSNSDQYSFYQRYSNNEQNNHNNTIQDKLLGIPLLYEIVLDNTCLNRELSDLALEFLIRMAQKKPRVDIFKNILNNCFENIKNNVSIFQSLYLIKGLFEKFDKASKQSRELAGLYFQKCYEEYILLKLLVNCCMNYCDAVREKIKFLLANNIHLNKAIIEENYQDYEFIGKFTHKQNIMQRILTIKFFIRNPFIGDTELDHQDIDSLWEIFVTKASFSFEQKIFLELISRPYYNDHDECYTLLNKNNSEYLFSSVICQSKKFLPEDITTEKFLCFDFYFKFTNYWNKKLRFEGPLQNFSILDPNLIGESILWEYFLLCKDDEISQLYTNLLVGVYIKFDEELQAKQTEIISDLLNNIMENISKIFKKGDNIIKVKRYLEFIRKLFSDYDKKDYECHQSEFTTQKFKVFLRCNDLGVQFSDIECSIHEKIGEFYERLCGLFQIEKDEFILKIDDQYINWSHCNVDLKTYCTNCKISVELEEPDWEKRKTNPKYVFSQNMNHIINLFDILSKISDGDYIWQFIRILPLNNQIKDMLEKMDNFDNLPFSIESINETNIHRFFYLLLIIQHLSVKYPYFVTNTRKFYDMKSRSEWSDKFSRNGFRKLIKILLKTDIFNLTQHNIAINTLYYLLRLIKFYYLDLLDELIQIKDDLFLIKILDIIQYQLNYYTKLYNVSRCTNDTIREMHSILMLASEIIQEYILNNFSSIKTLINYEQFPTIASSYLLTIETDNLKTEFFNLMRDLLEICSKKYNDYPNESSYFKDKIINLFFNDLLQQALQSKKSTIKFFLLLGNLLNNLSLKNTQNGKIYDQSQVMIHLIQYVKSIKPQNVTNLEEEKIQGIFHVLATYINHHHEYIKIFGQDLGLTQEILIRCIFKSPYDDDKIGPKSRYNLAIKSGFTLLEILAKDLENLSFIINYLYAIFAESKWRNCKISKWQISAMEKRRTSNYVGLRNMGCTCYLNSLMQQIYMIKSFRMLLLKVKDPKFDTTPIEDNMLYHFKRLFHYLSNIQKDSYNPKRFVLSIKDFDGNPTNFNEQKDVFEFFSLFVDQIEERIKGTKDENIIKFHFGGIFCNELICKGCPHHYERDEPYLAINLPIKNKKTILDSLDSFISGEVLEGENAYFCEKCNFKVKTTKRISIKKLPNYLILVLKRFEYDFDRGNKLKMNDYCEFPLELNMEPYTYQHIKRQERPRKHSAEQIIINDSNSFSNMIDNKVNSMYRLKGVIIHLGFADSGHYYSIIKDNQDGEELWYEFNDSKIKPFNIKDLPNIAFGNKNNSTNINLQNAYIIIYEKKNIHTMELLNEYKTIQQDIVMKYVKEISEQRKSKSDENPNSGQCQVARPNESQASIKIDSDDNLDEIKQEFEQQTPQEIQAFQQLEIEIKEKNMKYFLIKNIFTNDFSGFVYSIISNSDNVFLKQTNNNQVQIAAEITKIIHNDRKIFEFAVLIYYTTIIRMNNLFDQEKFCFWIAKKIENNKEYAKYLMSLQIPFFIEVYMECPISAMFIEIRNLNINLCKKCLRLVYQEEKKNIQNIFELRPNSFPITITTNFINFLINFLYLNKNFLKNANTYFHILYHITQCGKDLVLYLLKAKMVGRIMDFIFEFNVDKTVMESKIASTATMYKFSCLENGIYFADRSSNSIKSKANDDLSRYDLTYMWKTLEQLILYSDLTPEHSSYLYKKKPKLGFDLPQEEIYMFTLKIEYIKYIVTTMATNLGLKSISKIYGYLCYNNSEASVNALRFIKEALHEKDARHNGQLFKFIKYMCRINDNLQENRINFIVDDIVLYFKSREQNMLAINHLLNFLRKMIMQNACFKDKILESKLIPEILTWLAEKFGPKHKQKDFKPEINGIDLGAQLKEIKKNAKRLHDFFSNIIKNPNSISSKYEITQEAEKYPIDPKTLRPGVLVDYSIGSNNWVSAQVEYVIEDIAKVKTLDQKQEDWIELPSRLICPHKTKQQPINEIREIEDSESEYVTTNEQSDREDDGNSSNLSHNSLRTTFGA